MKKPVHLMKDAKKDQYVKNVYLKEFLLVIYYVDFHNTCIEKRT
jgi:hypothetical protein